MGESKKWKSKFENLNASSSKQAEQRSNDTKALESSLKAAEQEVKALKSTAATLQSTIESKNSLLKKQEAESKKWKSKFENLNASSSKQAEQRSNDKKALESSLKAAEQE